MPNPHAPGAAATTAANPAHDTPEALQRREHLWSLIRDIRFGMFTTRRADGGLAARPMTTQNGRIDADDSLWFFMSRGSETVRDLAAEPAVGVSYAAPDDDRYVSVAGCAQVVDDLWRKRALWNTAAEAWFPRGVDDPDLALVQVRIEQAEYWDVTESRPVQLFQMARAAVTGQTPALGEHRQVPMP